MRNSRFRLVIFSFVFSRYDSKLNKLTLFDVRTTITDFLPQDMRSVVSSVKVRSIFHSSSESNSRPLLSYICRETPASVNTRQFHVLSLSYLFILSIPSAGSCCLYGQAVDTLVLFRPVGHRFWVHHHDSCCHNPDIYSGNPLFLWLCCQALHGSQCPMSSHF